MAAILGVLVSAANTWYYEQTTQKFVLDEPQTIGNERDATFTFHLQEPQLASETTLEFTVEDIESTTNIYLQVNGQDVTPISPGENIVKLSSNRLKNSNTVRLYKKNIGFTDQKLVEARVTSNTSLQQLIFVLINFSSLLLVFLPIGYVKYTGYLRRKEMEEQFPTFLRDIVQGTRAGMSLPQAIQNTESANYGALNPHIRKMSAQIEWGVPFDKVLDSFGSTIGTPMVRRSVDTIIQAYTSGGDIEDVLESVGENIRSIKKLKEERQSQLYGEMITGYVVYFIFIGILIALQTYLLPNLAAASESLGGGLDILGSSGGGNLQENINLYEVWFSRLVYIQAIFSGIIIGKLSEGQLQAGLKHSAILFAVGYLSVTFFL